MYRWLKKGIYESHPALAELRLLGALFVYVGTMVGCMTALLVWRITSRIQNSYRKHLNKNSPRQSIREVNTWILCTSLSCSFVFLDLIAVRTTAVLLASAMLKFLPVLIESSYAKRAHTSPDSTTSTNRAAVNPLRNIESSVSAGN